MLKSAFKHDLNRKNVKFPESQLIELTQQVKSKEDAEFMLKCFYNFRGHKNNYQQRTIDQMAQTCLKWKCLEGVIHLLTNAAFVEYYPEYSTTRMLIKEVVQHQKELIPDMIKIFYENPFVKVDSEGIRLL